MLASQKTEQLRLFSFHQDLEQGLYPYPLSREFQDISFLNEDNRSMYNHSNASNGVVDTSLLESPNLVFCRPSDIFPPLWAQDQVKDNLKYATNELWDHGHPSTSNDTISIPHGNNCTLRFETPQKLQKYKREGHRNANAANMPTSPSITSTALLKRNPQIGPHRCERINPATGKPCSSTFKRPYDLTRHQNTIHNTRKQKVRCVLCVDEKTFTRKDALTRHMRVIHPKIHPSGRVSGRQNHSLSKQVKR